MESNLLTNGSIQPHVARFLWSKLTSREIFYFYFKKKKSRGKEKRDTSVCRRQPARTSLSATTLVFFTCQWLAHSSLFFPWREEKRKIKETKFSHFFVYFVCYPLRVLCVCWGALCGDFQLPVSRHQQLPSRGAIEFFKNFPSKSPDKGPGLNRILLKSQI